MERNNKAKTPAKQLKKRAQGKAPAKRKKAEITPEQAKEAPKITTGSTLLDLAITGSITRYGGVPGGVMAEIFGPPGSGKTVLCCEMAGVVQRTGAQVQFCDPEGRLNKQFARQFDLKVKDLNYRRPDTVKEVFTPIREWQPEPEGAMHGVFTDSLAALSTEYEMNDDDKRGQQRAKEFSQELRKTARVIANKGFIMINTNQVRENDSTMPAAPKYKSTGGQAIGFYSSLRLRTGSPQKLTKEKSYKGKKQKKAVGVETTVEVFKSSVAEPYKTAPLYVVFDYGIDDVRANLQWLKTNAGYNTYQVEGKSVGQSLDEAVATVEQEELENALIEEVVDTWHEIEEKFKTQRKKKKRWQ